MTNYETPLETAFMYCAAAMTMAGALLLAALA